MKIPNSITSIFGLCITFAVFFTSCTKKSSVPILTTIEVSAINQTGATSGGNVTDDGGAGINSRGVCWSLLNMPTVSDSKTVESGGIGSFTSILTSLSPNTSYYVRAYATNKIGTGYGESVTFMTAQALVAALTTTETNSVTSTSAISGGNITDDGGSAVTTRGVCWSLAQNPTISDNNTSDGTGTGIFTSNLSALSPGTTYFLRAYATNSAGTNYGNQVSFTTLAASGWTTQTSNTTANLRGITFIDIDTWVAVGDGGKILRSTDRGVHWATISSPVADALHAVSFIGNTGLAVGVAGRVIRSTDGGLTWIEETRPTTKILFSVSMSSSMSVITGEEGTILVSLDDGLTWTSHTAGTASILFGISVTGSSAVGVGGQGAIVMSTDRGAGWGLTVPGSQLTFFYSTSFVTGTTGWAVGSSSTTGSIIIHSTSSGFTWTAQTSPNSEQLFGVSFASLTSGTAVGANGTIIHTSDGGVTWLTQASGTILTLNAVSFTGTGVGIAVGDGGTILFISN
jgi:photosystem II stability/assembly factor-like uncharacterized protein